MTTAVLVMAYGTPTDVDDVANFYTDVRRGHPPTAEQLMDLERRYQAIGGISPLRERTAAQISQLQLALDRLSPRTFATYYGAKHAAPKIEESIDAIARQGITSMIGVVLAPHYSILSVGEYIERARLHANQRALNSAFVERWGDDQTLIDLLANRLSETIASIAGTYQHLEVLFSAHSLPLRILESGDRYPEELHRTAELVADRAGIARFRIAWQSAGKTSEPWLGPDLLLVLEQLQAEGVDGVVVCPAGFTSDHLEVLYDLDIAAAQRAAELGIVFARTRSLNDDPEMAQLLARRIVALASTDGEPR